MKSFDAVVLGAGAAGLYCAGIAGQRGMRVLLIDHAEKLAEKIRISGGGRCNFSNREVEHRNFLSDNPDFCRSALARHTPRDFIALVQRHRIAWHEKHKGQLFCDESSEDIISMLLRECEAGAVERWQPCRVGAVRQTADGFELDSDRGSVRTRQLVVATGGLSIPKIGASDFGHRLARQFGHRVIEPRPALVPLTFDAWPFASLSGVALPVRIAAGTGRARGVFDEDLLFTHRGLSGPGVLQVSSYWRPGETIEIDLNPSADLAATLLAAKRQSRRKLANELPLHLPARLAEAWLATQLEVAERPVADIKDAQLRAIASSLHAWIVKPTGTEGWRKAEVTAGGVDTRELESQTMQSRRVRGLHFIGEVVDVTGWLGGYNFQWAWASAQACAQALSDAPT